MLENKLFSVTNKYNHICLCYSGGVDSTLLLYLLSKVKPVTAITVNGIMVSPDEMEEAVKFANSLDNVNFETIPVDILELDEFRQNGPKRCYFCKKYILGKVKKRAQELGCDVVIDGSNIDDLSDYRPGLAAIEELGIKSPFIEAEFTKDDIYELSRKYDLPTKNKASGACLATRIPTGELLTEEKLKKVGEAEQYLKELGFKQLRLRLKDNCYGKIECFKEDFDLFFNNLEKIQKRLKKLGIIIEDTPNEYKTGSMNREVNNE